jgi:hypothetical protein
MQFGQQLETAGQKPPSEKKKKKKKKKKKNEIEREIILDLVLPVFSS